MRSNIEEEELRNTLSSPLQTGLANIPAIIDEETWVAVAVKMIEEEGVEPFLCRLLKNLKKEFQDLTCIPTEIWDEMNHE